MELRDKQALLHVLIEQGRLKLRVGHIFKNDPDPITPDWDRIEGMMTGLAIGDALGNPTEGMLPSRRRAKHGEIRDYQSTQYGVGVPSDDTQLAFWTLDQLNRDGKLVLSNLAQRFAPTVDRGLEWTNSGR